MTQPVRVQTSARQRYSAAGGTSVFSGNVVAGNTCIVLCGTHDRANATVPTDTLSTSYVLDKEFKETTYSGWAVAVYRGVFGSSGACTVTVPRSSAEELSFVCEELSGLVSSPLDISNTGTVSANWGTGSDTVTTTGTLVQADEIIYTLAMGRCDQTVPAGFSTLPPPTGFTSIGTAYLGDGTTTGSPCHFAYKLVSATTAVAPIWSGTEAQTNLHPNAAALLTVTYKGGAAGPSVTAVSNASPANGSALTITGTNFGASQGAGGVTLGGVAQTVTSWAATSIAITVARGVNQYGVALNIVVSDNSAAASNAFPITGIVPQSGWSYVNLTAQNADSTKRLTAIADLASGDQVAYDNKATLATVLADSTFYCTSAVASFNCEAWTSGGWGTTALQTINAVAPPPPPPPPPDPIPVPLPPVPAGRWNKVL
jgi:hypothetical protein